jgi:transcriptional regulator GlxA family with amidase domain
MGIAVHSQPQRPARACAFSVAFVLQPYFTLMPFASIIDAFRLAADDGDGSRPINCRWTIVGPDLDPIRASCGVEVRPWESFGDPGRFDYIIVVGGLLHQGGVPSDESTLSFLREADRKGVMLVGVCTGTFTLVRAKLMTGRRCCVSWFHYHDLIDEFPDVTPVADQLFVVDGNRITCAGGAGALDLAAWIIERHLGPASAQKSLHIMVVDHRRSANSPQPQPPTTPVSNNERVRRAMLLIEQNLSKPLQADVIAQQVNVSTRQLERLFQREVAMSVQAFSRKLRLNYGLWLLAQGRLTINEIAVDCGFSDASHFSRLVRSTFGLPPSAIRTRGRSAILSMVGGTASLPLPALAKSRTARPAKRHGGLPNERRPYVGGGGLR